MLGLGAGAGGMVQGAPQHPSGCWFHITYGRLAEDGQALPQMEGRKIRGMGSWCHYCLPWPLSSIYRPLSLFQSIKCSVVGTVRYSPPKLVSFS